MEISVRAKWMGGRLNQVTINKVDRMYRHYYSWCRVCFRSIPDADDDIYTYEGHNGDRAIYWTVCQACHDAISDYDFSKHVKKHTKDFKDAMEKFKERLRNVNH